MAFCILVSGPPCAGKSTLAGVLAARFRCALLSKDSYKEALFDELGIGDRRWSARLSRLAWDRLLGDAATLLVRGHDCVLEGNFRAADAEVLRALGALEGARLVEICCTATAAVLGARYRARAQDGSRHPGHVDFEALAEIEQEFAQAPTTVLGAGAVFACDTTRGVEGEGAIRWLESTLQGPAPGDGRG